MTWKRLPRSETATEHLVLEGDPPLLVRLGRWAHETEAPRHLASDAAELRRVLLELLAHDVGGEALGAFVREVLEPLRVASVGRWKWSGRVTACRERQPLDFGGKEGT